MDIKTILEQAGKDILTEETLNSLQTVFTEKVDQLVNERVELAVQTALEQQNFDHGAKFKRMVNALDVDHTKKMVRLVEAVEAKRLGQLKKVKTVYDNQIVEKAETFKNQLVESISTFLDHFIEEKVPLNQIKEAAKSNYLKKVLAEAREVLGVDERLIDKNFKNAILDGKSQIERLKKENAQLKQTRQVTEARKILAEKTQAMPKSMAAFVRRRLENKSPVFIKENIDYVVKLYKDSENNQKLSVVGESRQRSQSVDFVGVQNENVNESNENLINEDYNPIMDSYLEGLGANRE